MVPGSCWDDLAESMPNSVRRSLLPWEWSREGLWKLELPVRAEEVDALRHVLDIPLWRDEDETPFATAPNDVLAAPDRHPTQFARVLAADLAFPIHITHFADAWIVLDGVHRLAKAVHLERTTIDAFDVPARLYAAFAA